MRDVCVYFTFSSSYSYLAWQRIARLHPERYAGARLTWAPIDFLRLRVRMGLPPTPPLPHELAYNRIDAARWAARYGVPFVANPPRRFGPTQDAVKAWLLAAAEGPQRAAAWMERCFLGYRAEGADLSDRAVLSGWAREVGLAGVPDRLDEPSLDAQLAANTDAAFAAGAPGVPYTVVDGEGFWGNDRLAWVEARLAGKAAPDGV